MRFLLAVLFSSGILAAQNFFGFAAGISTLSADAAKLGSPATALSQYKPENGASISAMGGRHFSDWWSAQITYGWNRNSVVLSGIVPSGAYEIPLRSNMHTVLGEAQFYFRPRANRIRPYLAAGPGGVFERAASGSNFKESSFAFRVAVGLDAQLSKRFSLRYTFGETLQANWFSQRLLPPGSRKLANFQNQWGALWRF